VPVSAPAVSGVVPLFPPRAGGARAHASALTHVSPLFLVSTCLGQNEYHTLAQAGVL
jgi:hypothetical protein